MIKESESPVRDASPSPRRDAGHPGGLRALVLVVLALVLAAPAGTGLAQGANRRGDALRRDLGRGLTAVLTDDHRLFLEATPRTGEGLLAFSRRLTGGEGAAEAIAQVNGGSRTLIADADYRIPFSLLEDEVRGRVLRAVFPDDRPVESGWRHVVHGVGAMERESLWHLAEWFTGRGENFTDLRRANALAEEDLTRGREVVIPATLLIPSLRRLLPGGAASAPAPPPETRVADTPVGRPVLPSHHYDLTYRRRGGDEVAVYRLRPGEALYSSVIVRFTGRVIAADVNALAAEVAELSGIGDVTDIPVGYEIQVPMDLLLPEFLPPGHPRRQEYEQNLLASAAYSNVVRTRDLAGITVILDAGHGGVDVGASMNGVWESLYVYDVALRVKKLIEQETAAQVHMTTRDGDRWHVPEADVLPTSKRHEVLTDPPYSIEDSTVGVHLRWYLANSLYRRAVAGPTDPDKVVFLSLHGDSLHPSLRGMMAYVPGAQLIGQGFAKSGAVYAARREVREQPHVAFSWRERTRSEGLSRQLAERMVSAFEDAGLPVHPFKPVRDRVIRSRGVEWVPAVLRYNAIPAKALVEVVNLANEEDRRLIQTRAYRERIARAVVDGLRLYYQDGEGSATTMAAR